MSKKIKKKTIKITQKQIDEMIDAKLAEMKPKKKKKTKIHKITESELNKMIDDKIKESFSQRKRLKKRLEKKQELDEFPKF